MYLCVSLNVILKDIIFDDKIVFFFYKFMYFLIDKRLGAIRGQQNGKDKKIIFITSLWATFEPIQITNLVA